MTGELRLVEDTGRAGVGRQAELLSGVVDAVVVPANPHGTIHMAGLAAASLLIQHGLDPVLHVASRDRNRIALRGELLGATALGVTSLVLQRGDKMHGRKLSKEKKKKKVGSLKLLSVAKRLSDHQAMNNEPELYLGTRATVWEPNQDREPEVLLAKADAGAQFVQTQPCLDVDRLRRYMKMLVEVRFTHRCQMFVSVPILDSAESAGMLNESTRSGAVPKDVIKRLAAASSPERLGEELATRVLRELQDIPGVAGANLVSYGNIEMIPAVIAAAGLDAAS